MGFAGVPGPAGEKGDRVSCSFRLNLYSSLYISLKLQTGDHSSHVDLICVFQGEHGEPGPQGFQGSEGEQVNRIFICLNLFNLSTWISPLTFDMFKLIHTTYFKC